MSGLAVVLMLAAGADSATEAWLARNARALGVESGGVFAESVRMAVDVEEGGEVLRLEYRARRPDRVRVDVRLPDGGIYSEGCDAEGCWLRPPGGEVQAASPAGGAALQHGIVLPGKLYMLAELPALGHRVEAVGAAETGERVLVDVRLADGHAKRYFLDRTSGLAVAGRDRRALHPDVDATERRIESRYSDYRRVQGRLLAHVSCDVDLDTGETLACVRVRECSFDLPLPDEELRRPSR